MYRVCIADDEAYVRQSIVRRIETAGMSMMVAGTAEDGYLAKQLYESEKPDLFFVDIRMPGMDGLAFIEWVRKTDLDSRTRFIIVSGYDDFSYMQKAIKMGVADYIKKPFQQEEFEEMLKTVCRQIDEENLKESQIRRSSQKNYWESFYNLHKQETISGTFMLLYKKKIRHSEWVEQIESVCNPKVWSYLWFHGVENVLLLFGNEESSQLPAVEELNKRMRCYVIYEKGKDISLQEMILNMDAGLGGRFFTRMPYIFENKQIFGYQKITFKELSAALENIKQNSYSASLAGILKEVFSRKEQSPYIAAVHQGVIAEIADQYIKHGRPLPNDLRQEFLPMALAKYDTREELEEVLNSYARTLNQELVHLAEQKDVMERILQYMNLHYMDDISLSSLACEFFLAPTYLAKRFKKKTGQTVIQYLEEQRISRAKELLQSSGYTISEIAAMTGYNDANYFARSFKRVSKVTPREYRNGQHDCAN